MKGIMNAKFRRFVCIQIFEKNQKDKKRQKIFNLYKGIILCRLERNNNSAEEKTHS